MSLEPTEEQLHAICNVVPDEALACPCGWPCGVGGPRFRFTAAKAVFALVRDMVLEEAAKVCDDGDDVMDDPCDLAAAIRAMKGRS